MRTLTVIFVKARSFNVVTKAEYNISVYSKTHFIINTIFCLNKEKIHSNLHVLLHRLTDVLLCARSSERPLNVLQNLSADLELLYGVPHYHQRLRNEKPFPSSEYY